MIFRALKSYQDQSLGMKRKQEDQEAGILKLFRINAPHYNKKRKHFLPIIIKVRLKKGAQPVFVNYQTMRQQHTNLLLQFYEEKVMFRNMDQEMPADFQYDHSPQMPSNIEAKDIYELKKQESVKHAKNRGKRDIKEASKDKDSEKRSQSLDARPMRSCRLRSDHPRVKQESKEDLYFSNEAKSNKEEPQPEIQQDNIKVPQLSKDQRKKVLDYDGLVQSEGRQSLISPAVIPSTKVRQEIIAPIPVTPYSIVARIPYSQMDRDHFSSEQFKQSEQSEFVLDERGKQKRKRQKMLREQERLKRNKKSRRIKKKNKGSKH